MRSSDELTALFRERGLKITPQRELVFRLLDGNVSHPTAEAVYSAALEFMPMISLKTVYQVLNDLRGLGEIQSIEVRNAVDGTFTLSFGVVKTAAIAWNASASDIQTALEAATDDSDETIPTPLNGHVRVRGGRVGK